MLNNEQKEQLRTAIISYAAPRHPLKFTGDAIARQINNQTMLDFKATADDTETACSLLIELGLIQRSDHALGSTIYYSATSKCVLMYERGELL